MKLKFRINNKIGSRDILVQAHAEKRPAAEKPAGKTLFVLNIPPYVHEKELRHIFADAGPIANVILKENAVAALQSPESQAEPLPVQKSSSKYFNASKPIDKFKIAYIVFKSTKSLKLALEKTEARLYDDNNESILQTGIAKWTAEHMNSITDEAELEAEVNVYMKSFEEKEEEERQEARKPEVDDDGWVTVKRGKNAGFEQKESVLKALEEKMASDKKRKEFKNFYTFQLRESKQKHIYSLRRKFEQDKVKIDALKKARRFKPF